MITGSGFQRESWLLNCSSWKREKYNALRNASVKKSVDFVETGLNRISSDSHFRGKTSMKCQNDSQFRGSRFVSCVWCGASAAVKFNGCWEKTRGWGEWQ